MKLEVRDTGDGYELLLDGEYVGDIHSSKAAKAIMSRSPMPQAGVTEWRPIETAPKDRLIEVFAPGDASTTGAIDDLNDLVCLCQWHEDAGFCVDEIRNPTHWREHHRPKAPHASEAQDGSKE